MRRQGLLLRGHPAGMRVLATVSLLGVEDEGLDRTRRVQAGRQLACAG